MGDAFQSRRAGIGDKGIGPEGPSYAHF